MIRIIALLSAAGISLFITSRGRPQSAKPVPSVSCATLLDPAECRLVTTLQQGGVTVSLDGPLCNGTREGAYMHQEHILFICTNVNHTGGIGDTLRHEAIHVAQDCKDGLGNDTLVTLDGLPATVSAIESEAWTLAAKLTTDETVDLVLTYCQ